MSDINKLLEARSSIKVRKKAFVRHDSHKKKRVGSKWRKARGIQSKMRLGMRGYRKRLQIGYGSPKAVKGMHSTGVSIMLVSSVSDLDRIDAKKQGIVIAKNIGLKKRVEMVKKAQEQKIRILNIKDPAKFLSDVEQLFKKKREEKEKKKKEKKVKKEEKEKKAAEKEKEEEKEKEQKEVEKKETIESSAEEEDTKMKEKKKLDKLLIKKEK